MSVLSTPDQTTTKPKTRYCKNQGCPARQAPHENTARLRRDNPGPYCELCAESKSAKGTGKEGETLTRRTGTGTLRLTGLRRAMNRREMTYAKLAIACKKLFEDKKRSPISDSGLSNWAVGKYLVPQEDAEILAAVLKCSVEDLTLPPEPKETRLVLHNLRRIKDQSGKSWQALARHLGVSVPGLKHWAGAKTLCTCSLKYAEKIAEYYGVTLEELTTESGLSPDSMGEE